MKYFGFLSFGHYSNGGRHGITAAESLHQAIDLSVAADELGVNGAFFRVHHFAPQAAAPMPLLSAIASRTKAIEVGTGVIDMRYENPLYLAEEAAALDLIADGHTALDAHQAAEPGPRPRGSRHPPPDDPQPARIRGKLVDYPQLRRVCGPRARVGAGASGRPPDRL